MGRVLGWALLVVAVMWAAGESSLLLAGQQTDGLDSGEIWALLSGSKISIPHGPLWGGVVTRLLTLPAWSVLAVFAAALLLVSRKRQRPKRKMMFAAVRSSALH